MAQIRISFTTALVAVSLAICLVVALAFIDRSRRDDAEAASNAGRTSAQEQRLVSEAYGSPVENQRQPQQPGHQHQAPNLSMGEANMQQAAQPAQDAGSELPIDPRLSAIVAAGLPAGHAPAPRVSQEYAGLSPEQLARRFQGRAAVPQAQAAGAPPIAVPPGIQYAQPTPVPTVAPRATPAQKYQPILTNSAGVEGALKGMGGNYANSGPAADPTLPFSQAGTVSTDRLREALATGAGLDPHTLLPVGNNAPAIPATNAGSNGWAPVTGASAAAAASTPAPAAPRTYIKGGRAEVQGPPAPSLSASAPLGTQGAPLLSAPPEEDGALASLLANDAASLAAPGGASVPPLAGNNWNLPPAPGLPGAAIQPADAKVTQPPQLAAAGAAPKLAPIEGKLESDDIDELPAAVAQKLAPSEKITAASVNDRTLSTREAQQRAQALANLDGRKLDEDSQRMLSRTAAETWTEMVALAEEARKQGITVSDDELPQLMGKRSDIDQAELANAFKGAGFTDAEVQSEMRDLCLGEKLVEQTLAREFSEEKIRSIYEAKPDDFQSPRRLKVQEIYKAKPADEKAVRDVEKEMDKIQRQAASGADFGLLAGQVSEAPTKAKGGDLGWLDHRSAISKPMAEALLPLQPGQVSNVISEPGGYRILKMVEIQEPKPGFEGARDRVVEGLRDHLRSSLTEAAMAKAEVNLSHRSKKATSKVSSSKSRDAAVAKVLGASKNKRPAGNGSSRENDEAKASISATSAADAPPGFGGPDPSVTAPGTAAAPAAAAPSNGGPRGAVQGFFSRFRRPSPTIQQ